MQSSKGTLKSTDYSGFLGVGPYSTVNDELDNNQKENLLKNSVLYQLKDKNLTDNTVVSIYLKKDGLSLIKFGSYDK